MFFLIIYFPFFFSFFIGFFGRFFGTVGSSFIGCLGLFINFFLSIFALYFSFYLGYFFFFSLGNWIFFGPFELFWTFSFDSLAVLMCFVVNSISFVVHLFSFGYLNSDAHLSRFISYISFFTFFMLILISADNLIQLFLGWEGVGLCSYLLIGFWYTRVNAISSALKALVVNRISDFAIIVAILLSFWYFFSFDFSIVLSIFNFFSKTRFYFLYNLFFSNILTIICFFFLLGAMGKSAQILLHTWLPDAMEGPTPVSALIHAATMVTAGIFLILKLSPFFEYTGSFLNILIVVGGVTSFLSGTIGVVQYDIKKVIAYSTCSQLGYMLLACGLSNYFVSFFHLINHAFFKALLFLCAGCIIHSVNNEQDMRKMGGLLKTLPVVFIFMFIASLALAGFTFLTGFFSKDFILEQIGFFFYSYCLSFSSTFFTFFIFLTTALTSFYTFRLLFFTFFDIPAYSFIIVTFLVESTKLMLLPLFLLLIGSVFLGYFLKDFFLGLGIDFFSSTIFVYPFYFFNFETELISSFLKIFMFFFFVVFSFGIFPIFSFFFIRLLKTISNFYFFYNFFYSKIGFEFFFFLNSKWGFDILYNKFLNKPFFLFFYNHFYELFDKLLLERFFGHFFILRFSNTFFSFLRSLFQNGNLYFYFIYFILFILFILFV